MKTILRNHLWAFLLGSAICPTTQASDIIEVLPLTDRIIMVHFDDGKVIHHKLGENRNSDVLKSSPLDVSRAGTATCYTITSPDDTNYAEARNPSDVGRKSKGTDFTMSSIWTPDWQSKSWAQEHWIYLFLPSGMQHGKNYTLDTGTLATGKNSFSFVFNESELRSEAIHVNQVGYLPDARKKVWIRLSLDG